MKPATRETVAIAVTILREVVNAPARDQRPSPAIRLALRVLWDHCPETWPLTQFWSGINGSHDIGRSQTTNAALNGIERQLIASGAWSR